jgi:hypothetical protein
MPSSPSPGKIGLNKAATATGHDVHFSGVLISSSHHDGAKLLNQALDRHHGGAINRFGRARTPTKCSLWRDAVEAGQNPGGYWGAEPLPRPMREVFSEVDMLSHLIGAAYPADVRCLRQLETVKAQL